MNAEAGAAPHTEPDVLREIGRLRDVTEESARTGTRLDTLTERMTGLGTEVKDLRDAQAAQSKALTEALAGLTATLAGLNATVGQLGEQVRAMRVASEADVAIQQQRMDLERSAPERWRTHGQTVAEVLKAFGVVAGILAGGAAALWAMLGGSNGPR
jgi:hypothetical protein